VLRHYELASSHLAKTKGYEYYGRMSEIVNSEGGAQSAIDFFLDLQVWGTPEQCYERIAKIRSNVANDTFVGVFSYAGMPVAEAERNMRLFARSVMPELQKLSD